MKKLLLLLCLGWLSSCNSGSSTQYREDTRELKDSTDTLNREGVVDEKDPRSQGIQGNQN